MAREALECCKLGLWEIPVKAHNTKMPVEKHIVKARLWKFLLTTLVSRLKNLCVMFWQKIRLYFVHLLILYKTERLRVADELI